jgi:hypothetical protein
MKLKSADGEADLLSHVFSGILDSRFIVVHVATCDGKR